MQAMIPPTMDTTSFNTSSNLTIIVPTGSENSYAEIEAIKNHLIDVEDEVIQNQDISVDIEDVSKDICFDSQKQNILNITSEIPVGATLEVKSSDESIVTISEKTKGIGSYTIVASSEGTTTIKASIILNGIVLAEDTCTVTVSKHIPGSDYITDGDNHWHICSICDEKIDEKAHTLIWVTDKEATETEKGLKHQECNICGYKLPAVEIPVTATPTEPTKPVDDKPSAVKPDIEDKADSVKTGDLTNLELYGFMSGASIILMGMFYGWRKKKALTER